MRNNAMIFSVHPISMWERGKIAGILRESKCPNESLGDTFPERYHSMKEKGVDGLPTVYFDGGFGEAQLVSKIAY